MRMQLRLSAGAAIICVFIAEESTSKGAHSLAWQVGAGCWQGTLISSPCRTLHMLKYIYDVTAVSS